MGSGQTRDKGCSALMLAFALGSQQGIASAAVARLSGATIAGIHFHALTYALIGVVAITIGVIAQAFYTKHDSWAFIPSGLRVAIDAVTAVMTVGATAGLAVLEPAMPLAFWLCLASASGVAWYSLRWGENLSKLPTGDLFRAISAKIVASGLWMIVTFLLSGLGWGVVVVSSAVCMLAGFLLLRIPDALQQPECDMLYPDDVLPCFGGIVMGVFAFGLLFGLREFFDYADAGVVGVFSNVLAIATGLALYWWVYRAHRSIDFDLVFRAGLVMFAVGVFLAPLCTGWGSDVVEGLMSLVVLLITNVAALLCAYLARHSSLHPFLVFGIYYALYGLPRLLEPVVGLSSAGVQYLGDGQPGFYHALMLLIATVAAATSLIKTPAGVPPVFGDFFSPRISAPEGAQGDDARDSADERFARVGERFDLTERETQVMQLICHGRSKSYIAETLYLSENTVRMHSKSLYLKLGVHSKQELIDLVEGGNEEGGETP